ncbi:MAG: transcriptional regulator BetI [Alphaproteobacteria bacterium]|nr:transcriptional regulator BetI [Alphaproteobacteria bacterium]
MEKKPSRSRAANKLLRRQQLIDATIQCIETMGFADTTLAKVAEKAGLSQGIVIFHFKSKETLFEETLRYLALEYKAVFEAALSKAKDSPIDRLCTMIRTDFDPKICNETKIGIWHSFWGEAKTRPLYRDLYGYVDKELYETLLENCKELSKAPSAQMEAEDAVLAIDSMINGLWQRCFLAPKQFNRKRSLDMTFDLLGMIYPDQKEEILKHKKRLK